MSWGDALRRDGHPPLYYALSNLWMQVVGESNWAARALAGVLSVLGLPLSYLAGCRLAERRGAGPLGVRRTGLIALAIMAMLPYGIRYAAENRMYSLVITLVLAGYLLADDLLSARSPSRRPLVAAGATLVAAALLWSHYWSIWLLAALGLVALWRAWRDRPERRLGARWLIGALVVGGLLFLPWLPTMLYQTANTGTPWGTRFGPASVIVISVVDFAGARFGAAALLTYLLVPARAAGEHRAHRRPSHHATGTGRDGSGSRQAAPLGQPRGRPGGRSTHPQRAGRHGTGHGHRLGGGVRQQQHLPPPATRRSCTRCSCSASPLASRCSARAG